MFLDRDGTICEEVNYLGDPALVRLLPGAAEGIAMFNAAQIPVVLVTNQAGVARGYFTEEDVRLVNARLLELLAADGASIDAVYHCPHHPEKGAGEYLVDCDCRKPAPGMLLRAAEELGLDVSKSYMLGDKDSDILAGRNAGCAGSALVATGYGEESLRKLAEAGASPDFTAPDFLAAAKWILDRLV